MSLQSRLSSLITAIGADIKRLTPIYGLYANRPAAATAGAGAVYVASDAGVYISNGTSWKMYSPGIFYFNEDTARTLTSTTFAFLPTTPDVISSLALPPGGLFKVGYQAIWKESAASTGRAAIFMGANQLAVSKQGAVSPNTSARTNSGTANIDIPLFTAGPSLETINTGTGGATEVTTGQAIGMALAVDNIGYDVNGASQGGTGGVAQGGMVHIWGAAGVYDVGVKFRSTSGNVTVKNRKLWVEVWGN